MVLYIYAARYDFKYMCAINVAGYSCSEPDRKEGKAFFKLTYHTGRKTNTIEFAVLEKAAAV